MYFIIYAACWLAFHIVYRMRVIGLENLPQKNGYIICPNHLHGEDPIFVVTAQKFGRPFWILAKEELFHNKFLAAIISTAGAVPIERGKGDKSVLDDAIRSVREDGRNMLIFPEGTRNKTGEGLLPLKSGAFVVAQEAGAPIVPCRIIYKGGRKKLFGQVTVAFGKPISLEEMGLADGEYSARKLRSAKSVLKERLEKLLEENSQYQ